MMIPRIKFSNVIIRLYQFALACFPPAYQAEYADELLFAVRMAASDIEVKGGMALALFGWRELRDLPQALIQVHIQGRKRGMDSQPTGNIPGGPIRGWKVGAVFLPFLLPLFIILPGFIESGQLPVLPKAAGTILLAALAAIWFAAFARGFPTWALPALGLVLYFFTAILGVIALGIFHYLVVNPLSNHGLGGFTLYLPIKFISVYCSILFICFLLAGFLRLAPDLRRRVQQDWTILSFLLLGTAILPVLRFDEYTGLNGYQSASLAALILGAGAYLLARQRWLKITALVAAALFSQGLMCLGIFQVFNSQVWAGISSSQAARILAAVEPLSNPLPVLLLLPAWIIRLSNRLKASPDSSVPAAPERV